MAAKITPLTLTSADTEYVHTTSSTCRAVSFQARTEVACRFAFLTGQVAGPTGAYATLKANQAYGVESQAAMGWPHFTKSVPIYFAAGAPGVVIEITEWE